MSGCCRSPTAPELRRHARRLARAAPRARSPGVVTLHAFAAAAGLVGPALLGTLVQSVGDGTTTAYVDTRRARARRFIALQTVLTWLARRTSFVVSEQIFAELREDFMRRSSRCPLSTVERAGTGDLVSRTTADVDSLARTIRFAIPETLIAAVTTRLTVGAAIWVSPPAALTLVAGVPAIWIGTRWYLRRAPQGYLRERAAYATLAGTVGETVDGGLTVESLSLDEHRVRRSTPTRGGVPRRAVHAAAADVLVPHGRDRVRPPGRRRRCSGAAGSSTRAMRRSARSQRSSSTRSSSPTRSTA